MMKYFSYSYWVLHNIVMDLNNVMPLWKCKSLMIHIFNLKSQKNVHMIAFFVLGLYSFVLISKWHELQLEN